ncbi:MAG: nuclear transport factor 2 family protein [Gammaproteobacteria bacterium]|nr:nuclear transport factor 2 family protein [Gammaproteobacteria bacterium]MBV9695336.1 nuclear transport factor 2 family protein [Gammaproteobacteria bacterium]
MKTVLPATLVGLLMGLPSLGAEGGSSEQSVWAQERAYWQYVKTNDLARYRTLWHKDFLGWPLTSPEPMRKDHITDWITAHTSAGETLKSYSLEPLAAQATDDYVTVAYRVHLTWLAKDGTETPGGLRVVHTWRHSGGQWQIISGMAAAPNAQGH